ncbi:DUF4040 domain-containing protein [Futiania mangrovi]|uniref:DUF4040 domain-containing protein n=1 Tax=Futiania mangrovi TaxID=2959716 RepID=A0A9J6PIY0_9PROT|nr:DUF4040 domain-containing protein [Futiania mangrovii]MCP1336034.1 DUF4040 domain-containing protein [Futiania mangrovii]
MEIYVNVVLMGMLAIIALAIVRVRHLFAAVMLAGVYSLVAAIVFVSLDAVDVAFTEAAVGAGVSTLLFLGALALTTRREKVVQGRSIVPLVVVLAVGAALVYGTLDLPKFGDPSAPVQTHVAPFYIQDTRDTIQIPNIVTTVLASYRGFDTLGEVVVVFTAGIGVILLIGRAHLSQRRPDDDKSGEEA